MDPLSTTVFGSRHPITFPSAEQTIRPLHLHQTSRDSGYMSYRTCQTSTRSRRKPTRTYKSPAAHEAISLRIEGHVKRTEIVPHPTPDKSTSEATGSSSSTAEYYHLSPPLPVYHPQGFLALSVPALDPTLYGHPNAVNVEEYAQVDADAIRRSSSRARRPAAKLRDRDMADDEMSAVLDGVANSQAGVTTATSPRKRRAGGVSGTRRRRRENGADSAYPNPPKRTRNTRGASAVAATFASPLAGPSITTAEDNVPDVGDQGELDNASVAQEAQDNESVVQTTAEDGQEQRRSTRSRRSRPAATRRHSSASETTTTSVSISIAVGTRNTRTSSTKALQEPITQVEESQDVEMKMEEQPDEQAKHVEQASMALVTESQPDERPSVVSEVKESGDQPGPEPEPAPEPKSNDKRTDGTAPIEIAKLPQDDEAAPASETNLMQKDDWTAVVEEAKEPQPQSHPAPVSAPIPVPASNAAPAVVDKTTVTVKPKEPSLPEKPKTGQKISPSSWPRFVPPVSVAISGGLGASQKKARDEEKEEGELSEESEDSIPPRRR